MARDTGLLGGFARFEGSDVYARYSSEYVWYANQFGHVGLGALWTLIGADVLGRGLAWLWDRLWGEAPEATWFKAALVAAFVLWYLSKEAGDWRKAQKLRGGTFDIDERELRLDIVADIYFVLAGVAIAHLPALPVWWGLGIFVVLFAVALAFRWHYVPGCKQFDRSGLPFYFRLPAFKPGIEVSDPRTVTEFAQGKSGTAHLLVVGPRASGKTSLAVGIGSRLSRVERKMLRYTTAFKLIEDPGSTTADAAVHSDEPWPAATADYLIVDDLDVAIEPQADPGQWTPGQFLGALVPQVRDRLRTQRTVWVLGDTRRDKDWAEELERHLDQAPTVIRLDPKAALGGTHTP